MASVIDDPNGRRRIQFVDPHNGRRKTIRLGKIDRRTAERIAQHVEALRLSQVSGLPVPRDTAAWLAGIGEALREKLAAVGLIESRRRLTVAEFVTQWLADKQAAGYKPTSLRAWRQTGRLLIERLGDRSLVSLTHADGEAFRQMMQAHGLRPTTIHKRLGHARQMLEDAVRFGHIPANPLRYVRQRTSDPSERRVYVPVEVVQRVIEYAPGVHWKLLIALARFGGLRIPSEAFSLTWGDVNWEQGRLTVPSPKTEHCGKPHRVIPLFPLLRPYLEAAFDQAQDGDVYIFPQEWRQRAMGADGWAGANMRTMLAKIIRKAGVEPWPRIWHNLRASCESDLAQSFPLATVAKWLGNTPSVALRHYVDPTEAAFQQALTWNPVHRKPTYCLDVDIVSGGAESGALVAQKAAQQDTEACGRERRALPEVIGEGDVMPHSSSPCRIVYNCPRECIGIEPTEGVVHTLHGF